MSCCFDVFPELCAYCNKERGIVLNSGALEGDIQMFIFCMQYVPEVLAGRQFPPETSIIILHPRGSALESQPTLLILGATAMRRQIVVAQWD